MLKIEFKNRRIKEPKNLFHNMIIGNNFRDKEKTFSKLKIKNFFYVFYVFFLKRTNELVALKLNNKS